MRIAVVSYKGCWVSADSATGYATIGGFPFQMEAISQLFDQTTLVLPVFKGGAPAGLQLLAGRNISVRPLDGPPGSGARRKAALLPWLPRNLPRIWQEINRSEGVHAVVPGDIGVIGILVALAQRKPLFIRHCGTWGYKGTLTDRFILWLLERIAGGRNVVLATGGGAQLPSAKNPAIDWVFATTLAEKELLSIPRPDPWRSGKPLRLITVARLDPVKNVEAAVRALLLVSERYPQTTLEIVGDGPSLDGLKALACDLGIGGAVIFRGRLAHRDVLDRLSASHVFVFPTREAEGFPKALLEALACGLPAVVPPVSVLPHLVGRRNGAVLKGTDPRSVAEAILDLIGDEERLAKMSANAWQEARRYTLERWREAIGAKLQAGWGPLRENAPNGEDPITVAASEAR